MTHNAHHRASLPSSVSPSSFTSSSVSSSADSPFRRALVDAAFGSLGLGAGYGAGLLAGHMIAPVAPRIVLHNRALPMVMGMGGMGAAILARRAQAERDAWRDSEDPAFAFSSSLPSRSAPHMQGGTRR